MNVAPVELEPSAAATAGFQRWRATWCAAGVLLAVPLFLGLSGLVGALLRHRVVPAAGTIGLSLIPLHLGATAAVLGALALACHTAAGARLVTVLELAGTGFGRNVKAACWTWLWVYPAALLLALLGSGVGHWLQRPPQVNPMLELLVGASPLTWLVAWGAVTIAAPLAEELLFRLALQEALARFLGRYAVFLVALLFSFAHGIPEQVPALVMLSVALQRTRERTGSLWTPILVHALFNAGSLALLWLALRLGVEIPGL